MAKRSRQNDLHIYLNDAEFEALQTLCDRTKKPKSVVVRQLIQNVRLVEAPPAHFKQFTVELRRIGTNLNQLVAKANSIGYIDREECEAVLADYRTLERQIAGASTAERVRLQKRLTSLKAQAEEARIYSNLQK